MKRPIIIEITVGYMLKVWKSQKKISKYKAEFNAIRHGDYFEFIQLIGEAFNPFVSYNNGLITLETESKKNDLDFAGLIKAGPSLKSFFKNCFEEYGEFIDNDISDLEYYDIAMFEIALRMHSNNNNLLKKKENLDFVIDSLCDFKKIPENEKLLIHNGRKFLNLIKHPKGKTISWNVEIQKFKLANETLLKYGITVI